MKFSIRNFLYITFITSIAMIMLPVLGYVAGTPVKVACIGDSITQGVGASTSYPARLAQLLGSNYTVNNYGVSGTTMLKKGDSPYWNQQAYTDSGNWLPDIVIIMLGTNDSKNGTSGSPNNWSYKSEFLPNYKEMINHYKNLASHPTVYLNTCPTVYNAGNFGITNPVVTGEVVPLVKQVGYETGCRVNDVNTATQNMSQNFPDNVHPNDAGAQAIAQTTSNGLTLAGTSAFTQIEAERYNIRYGSVQPETCGEGGQDLGYISNGDFIAFYKVDFGSGATSFNARVASAGSGGSIGIYLDSSATLIGTCAVPVTGGWQTWATQTCSINGVSGVHDIYLKFTGSGGSLFNINWVKFISGTTATPTPTATPTNRPTATPTRTPGGTTLFTSGLESGNTQPTWANTIEVSTGVTGYTTGINPECSVRTGETAHAGTASLMFSGNDNSATTSYCYFKVFDVNIPITSTTKLSYWFYPQMALAQGVAVDFVCTDGTTLRDSGARDQNNISMHPGNSRGTVNLWNQVQCNVGQWLNGKTIDRILVGYDLGPSTGQFRGYIDDITINN